MCACCFQNIYIYSHRTKNFKMKYALALVLILALILPNIETSPKNHGKNGGRDGGRNGGHHDRGDRCQPSVIFTCIQRYIDNNATISAAFIDALNNAGLSQYIVEGKINYTGLKICSLPCPHLPTFSTLTLLQHIIRNLPAQ